MSAEFNGTLRDAWPLEQCLPFAQLASYALAARVRLLNIPMQWQTIARCATVHRLRDESAANTSARSGGAMSPLINRAYLNSEPGALTALVAAGTSLENPYVYDSAARELKILAEKGLVEIAEERSTDEALIGAISFRRLR
jgi:hypothetical protein